MVTPARVMLLPGSWGPAPFCPVGRGFVQTLTNFLYFLRAILFRMTVSCFRRVICCQLVECKQVCLLVKN